VTGLEDSRGRVVKVGMEAGAGAVDAVVAERMDMERAGLWCSAVAMGRCVVVVEVGVVAVGVVGMVGVVAVVIAAAAVVVAAVAAVAAVVLVIVVVEVLVVNRAVDAI